MPCSTRLCRTGKCDGVPISYLRKYNDIKPGYLNGVQKHLLSDLGHKEHPWFLLLLNLDSSKKSSTGCYFEFYE